MDGSRHFKAGTPVKVDGWRRAVICDVRKNGTFYTTSGDNCRERFEPDDPRVEAVS